MPFRQTGRLEDSFYVREAAQSVAFLPAATARWSISAVSSSSPQRTIEHGSIETNELNMTLMSHMTRHDSV